jgi:UPF0042 nucleotide-binding protein
MSLYTIDSTDEASVAGSTQRLLMVVSGLSGSGISTALEALEDQGYFCVDNLPPPLINKLAELASGQPNSAPLAIGLDARSIHDEESAKTAVRALEELKQCGYTHHLVFLEASEEVLLKRFSTSRRSHPLSRSGLSLSEAMSQERHLMKPMRGLAQHLLDTTEWNVHECKRRVKQIGGQSDQERPLALQVMSFGFRHGIPREADIIWDVRFLPNPHFIPELRPLSGLDEPVKKNVLTHPMTVSLLQRLSPLLIECLPAYEREGKSYLTIAIGCTGGHHRSVAVAEAIKERLSLAGWSPHVHHRDLEKSY